MIKQMGLRMDGNENFINDLILKESKEKKGYVFNFLEIGTAGGKTLSSIYDILLKNKIENFRIISLDLPVGSTALDFNQIQQNLILEGFYLRVVSDLNKEKITIPLNVPSIILKDASKFIPDNLNYLIDIAFIDGCHCKEHVKRDFLAIEKFIGPKGIVMFHDFSLPEQGTDLQHDNEFIQVRAACSDLGLIDNKYPGWKFETENVGSRIRGGDGNGIGVFRKL